MSAAPAPLVVEPGSFRDPCSRVYRAGTRIFRALTAGGLADYQAVAATRFFAEALASGRVVGTRRLADPLPTVLTTAQDAGTGRSAGVLEHDVVGFVTYPYEWSFGMLLDAALLQLRLVRDGIADGVMCKDGTAFNVLFDGARPVFIDVGSFQPLLPGEPWPGYRQFCQTYLYPLLITAHTGTPFQPLLRGAVDGIPPPVAKRFLSGGHCLHRGVLTHVHLHDRAQQRYGRSGVRVAAALAEAGLTPRIIDATAARLERLVGTLRFGDGTSEWSRYATRSHYSSAALDAKDAFVRDALGRYDTGKVLDLGCNDGRYARIAAGRARSVVAADSDHVVVERLYQSLKGTERRVVTPLVIDLADPSPALGWRHQERAAFFDRLQPDLVLCLALVHHLAIGRNVPIAEIVAMLASLDAPVVLEVPDHDDAMVRGLVAGKRPGVHDDYSTAEFRRQLAQRFHIAGEALLPGNTRTLLELVPRRATASRSLQ